MDSANIPPPVAEVAKKVDGRKKPRNEAQLAGLRKGFEMMKAKRAANEAAKAEKEKAKAERKAAGIPEPEPEPKIKVKRLPPIVVEEVKLPEPKVKAPRKDKGVKRVGAPTRQITREEFDELKNIILANTKPIETVKEIEKVVEKVVPGPATERVVERVVTGREMLDKLFFGR